MRRSRARDQVKSGMQTSRRAPASQIISSPRARVVGALMARPARSGRRKPPDGRARVSLARGAHTWPPPTRPSHESRRRGSPSSIFNLDFHSAPAQAARTSRKRTVAAGRRPQTVDFGLWTGARRGTTRAASSSFVALARQAGRLAGWLVCFARPLAAQEVRKVVVVNAKWASDEEEGERAWGKEEKSAPIQ